MAGLGQLATTTGRARGKVLRDAIIDNHPIFSAMKEVGGIRRETSGRTVVEEAKMAQNANVAFTGENGTVDLYDTKVLDAAEFDWVYLMGSYSWSRAEELKNRGENRYIDLIGGKLEVLEDSTKNILHGALWGDGTTTHYPVGIKGLVPITTTSGTVGSLDRSSSSNAWFRSQSFTSSTAVSETSVDAANALRFLDYGIELGLVNSRPTSNVIIAGATHWPFFNQAITAKQVINDTTSTGKAGFDSIVYRGRKIYNGGGLQYTSYDQCTATYTYFLNVQRGGVNLVYMKGAEFDLLDPVDSADQAVRSRLMFTMLAMTIGAHAKKCIVGYNA